jgi:hypothetical protein
MQDPICASNYTLVHQPFSFTTEGCGQHAALPLVGLHMGQDQSALHSC